MDYPKDISNNISFKEATKSYQAIKHGIDNVPNEEQLANMISVAEKIFQPVREHFSVAIGVSSFFRHPEVNKAVGGAKASQHMKGQAIDLDADTYDKTVTVDGEEVLLTNKMIFDYIVANLEFDTILWEFGTDKNPNWVHVSYVEGNNRGRKLVAYKDNNKKTQYKFYS